MESLSGAGLPLRFARGATAGDAKQRLASVLPEQPASGGMTLVCAGRVLRNEERLPGDAGAVVHVVLARDRCDPYEPYDVRPGRRL